MDSLKKCRVASVPKELQKLVLGAPIFGGATFYH